MAKLTKWEKTELLQLYKRERSDARCLIVQTLTRNAKDLTKDLDPRIKDATELLHKLNTEKENILKENNLYEFEGSSQYTCRMNTLHKRLIAFDKETTAGSQKIIRGE